MATDEQPGRDVPAELDRDPSVDGSCLGIEVAGGIVTVRGELGSGSHRGAIPGTVCKVPGVREVVDLTVIAHRADAVLHGRAASGSRPRERAAVQGFGQACSSASPSAR